MFFLNIQFADSFLFSSELILADVVESTELPAEEEEEHPEEREGLFGYRKRQKRETTATPQQQLSEYIDMTDGQNALRFWQMHKNSLPSLYPIAMRVLSVPASSAPVERVFSHGGIIMRPHRSNMHETTFSNLIFCKCNKI